MQAHSQMLTRTHSQPYSLTRTHTTQHHAHARTTTTCTRIHTRTHTSVAAFCTLIVSSTACLQHRGQWQGAPACVRIYQLPNTDTPLCNKSFYKADKVTMSWNKRGQTPVLPKLPGATLLWTNSRGSLPRASGFSPIRPILATSFVPVFSNLLLLVHAHTRTFDCRLFATAVVGCGLVGLCSLAPGCCLPHRIPQAHSLTSCCRIARSRTWLQALRCL